MKAVGTLSALFGTALLLAGCGANLTTSSAKQQANSSSGVSVTHPPASSSGSGSDAGTNAGLYAPHPRGIWDCGTCFAGGSSATSILPAGALATDQIQSLTSWIAATDTSGGGGGSANGSTQIVQTPSMSGAARAFTTTFSNSGDERYAVTFGEDTASTHFLYDGWIYIADPSAAIANLEMDMNQVLANGQTVIFGFQCDGYSGTWDYTENAGTPEAPVDEWVHSAAACNPRSWQPDVWHQVQISYQRDDAGNVTYNTVWLDGSEQPLNVTVPSAFALGWGSTLLTNFQVDGLGSGGSSTVYLDNLTVFRW